MLLVVTGAVCAIGLWPALTNGFPVIYDDTGVYLMGLHTTPSWPIFYSLFVVTGRLAGNLWVPVVLQTIVTIYLLTKSLSLLAGQKDLLTVSIWVSVLLAITQLPWLLSYVTADLFGGLSILCLIVLILKWEQMHWFDRMLFLGTAIFGGLAATANAFVLLPLGIAMFTAHRNIWRSNPSFRIAAGVFAFALIVLPVATNGVRFGHFMYAGGSSARMFSKLVDKGLAVPFLEAHCRYEHYHACDHLKLIRDHAGGEGFLWDGPASANGHQAWRDYDGDYARLVRQIVFSHPLQVISFAAKDITTLAQQITLLDQARVMTPHLTSGTARQILNKYPAHQRAFSHARQQQGTLTRVFPKCLYTTSVFLSFLSALLCLWIFHRSDRKDAASATFWIICALLVSLIVHGGLGSPIARYNVKVSWLLWIPAAALLISPIRVWQSLRRRAQKGLAKC